jgi:hypothetical protein
MDSIETKLAPSQPIASEIPKIPPRSWPKKIAWAIFLGLMFVYVLSVFVPWDRAPSDSEIDASWLGVLHWAHVHHADFGHQIVFTYGPWGFTINGYLPRTFADVVAVWTFLAMAYFAAACSLPGLSHEPVAARDGGVVGGVYRLRRNIADGSRRAHVHVHLAADYPAFFRG